MILLAESFKKLRNCYYLYSFIIFQYQQVIVTADDIYAFPINSTGYKFVVIRISAHMDICRDIYYGQFPHNFMKRN